jgi:hypothetical protein
VSNFQQFWRFWKYAAFAVLRRQSLLKGKQHQHQDTGPSTPDSLGGRSGYVGGRITGPRVLALSHDPFLETSGVIRNGRGVCAILPSWILTETFVQLEE